MSSDAFLLVVFVTAFLVAFLFPRLRYELAPENYPTDGNTIPKVMADGAIVGAFSIIVSIIVSVFHASTSTPVNAADITYHSVMLTVIATPVIEELLIRGILTESVRTALEKFPKPVWRPDMCAEAVSAVVFVGLHVSGSTNLWITFLTIPVLAVVLGEIRRRHGIIASILGHIAYNVVIAFTAIILTAL